METEPSEHADEQPQWPSLTNVALSGLRDMQPADKAEKNERRLLSGSALGVCLAIMLAMLGVPRLDQPLTHCAHCARGCCAVANARLRFRSRSPKARVSLLLETGDMDCSLDNRRWHARPHQRSAACAAKGAIYRPSTSRASTVHRSTGGQLIHSALPCGTALDHLPVAPPCPCSCLTPTSPPITALVGVRQERPHLS